MRKHTIIDEPDYRQEEEERLTQDKVIPRELEKMDVCYTTITSISWENFLKLRKAKNGGKEYKLA